MELFDVYPLFDIAIEKGQGCHVWDDKGQEYLDLYGGHAVISVGHAHPHYVEAISSQVAKLGFYSNSVQNPLQQQLAHRLGKACGYEDYQLFLINSGAEANENALKLASFYNGRTRVLSLEKAFHGRTSLAVEATANPKIIAPINANGHVTYLPINDIEPWKAELEKDDVCAVIIECIQGVGGIRMVEADFLQQLKALCEAHNTVLICDEIQCGYGRSGKFFAHQWLIEGQQVNESTSQQVNESTRLLGQQVNESTSPLGSAACLKQEQVDMRPDMITVAKGICNGFPMGGVLISPKFKPVYGQLGTTFGGNHLGCAGALAVLDIIEDEKLVENAHEVGEYIIATLTAKMKAGELPHVVDVRGRGLMIGIELDIPYKEPRTRLIKEEHIFTGCSGTNVIRLLPPLCVTKADADQFIASFAKVLA